MKYLLPALAAIAVACTAHAQAQAQADTPPQMLRQAAEEAVRTQFGHAGDRVVIQPVALNPRWRLPRCTQPLHTRLPPRQGAPSRVAVMVSCGGSPGWSIAVPVQLQIFRHVLVLSRPVARGDIPGPADVHLEERDIARLGYGYIASLAQIGGRSMARPLMAGSVLEPGDLSGRQTVHAGEEVALIAQLGDIQVRTSGMAMDGGDTGAHLRVRNDSSGRIIEGVVLGDGQVLALP